MKTLVIAAEKALSVVGSRHQSLVRECRLSRLHMLACLLSCCLVRCWESPDSKRAVLVCVFWGLAATLSRLLCIYTYIHTRSSSGEEQETSCECM